MSKARDLANAGTALGAVTATELAYIDGVTSAIQTQIDSKIGSASAINPTIVDAKGDIIAATAADTVSKLTVGSNDTVLTADSSTATGLKWATPAAGANFTLLNSGGTALSGAQTVTVSGISGKNKIVVIIDSASSANNFTDVIIRLNTDTGSNYTTFGNIGVASGTYTAGNFGGYKTSSTGFLIAKQNDVAAGISHGALFIDGCNSSGLKMVQGNGGGTDAGGGFSMRFYSFGGIYNSASVITSVSAFSNSGTWDAGTIYVYTSA